MPLWPLKGSPKYLPEFATMVMWSEYLWMRWVDRGTTPYAAIMSRQSGVSYNLQRYKKISLRTSFLISIICCRSLASREVFLVSLPMRKPWRVSWNWITDIRQRFSIPVTLFHRTSTRHIPQESPFPFGIRMTVYQVHSSVRWPSSKVPCISLTTFSRCVGSGNLSLVAACNKDRSCSTLTPDELPALFHWKYQTAQATTSSSGIPSSTGKVVKTIGMLLPGGVGDLQYSPTLYVVTWSMVTLAGESGLSSTS